MRHGESNIAALSSDPLPLKRALQIGFGEIVADIKQRAGMLLGDRIRKAVAGVEPCRMRASFSLRIGCGHPACRSRGYRHDFKTEPVDKTGHGRATHRSRQFLSAKGLFAPAPRQAARPIDQDAQAVLVVGRLAEALDAELMPCHSMRATQFTAVSPRSEEPAAARVSRDRIRR